MKGLFVFMRNMFVSDILKAADGTLIMGDVNAPITDICIDSNKIPPAADKTLFIPLKGEKVDAHKFAIDAIAGDGKALAAGVIISEKYEDYENLVKELIDTAAKKRDNNSLIIIKVKDTKKALQDIGAYYRKTRNIRLVGITGSVGKTTTREMTATALKPLGSVYQTKGNRNSQTGVPLTLADIADESVGVIELGMSEAGEIEIISKLADLDAAIITNIGVAHLMQLKTRENICREKLSIVKGLKDNGFIFLNGDDDFQRSQCHFIKHKYYFYGEAADCDFRIINAVQTSEGMNFTLQIPDKSRYNVTIPVMGMHNVKNAAAAMGTAIVMGAEPLAVIKEMASFGGVKMRQQILTKNGYTIIDDSYNANPDSMKAGLGVLDKFICSGKRIALLADMKELGDDEIQFHSELGKTVAALNIDMLITVGKLAGYISETAVKNNSKLITMHAAGNKEAGDFLKSQLKAGDVLFVKGSRSMALDEVIKML